MVPAARGLQQLDVAARFSQEITRFGRQRNGRPAFSGGKRHRERGATKQDRSFVTKLPESTGVRGATGIVQGQFELNGGRSRKEVEPRAEPHQRLGGARRAHDPFHPNDGTLQIRTDAAGTLSNAVSGTGRVVKSGTSNLTLAGDNSYQGGTVINAGGAVLVGSDARLASSGWETRRTRPWMQHGPERST